MKIAVSLASMGLASAFVETLHRGAARAPALRASDPRRGDGKFVTREIPDVRDVVSGGESLDTRVPPPQGFRNRTPLPLGGGPAAAPARRAPAASRALPFAPRPALLDGGLAGDAGFDPLGFADSRENLARYREAEIKHGRLAMLAAAGWPLSELWDARIAQFLGLEPALNPDGRVPSVLNGGMGKIGVTYWLGCIVLAAALDVYGSYFATKRDGYVAGDLGFDPLGFYPRGGFPRDERGRERMRLAEIKHGRLAMVAIVAFAAQEFVAHVPVVDQTPLFFKPLTEVLSAQVPQYYVPPEAVTEAAAAAAPALAPAAVEAASSAAAAVPEFAAPAAVEATSSAAVEAVAAAPEAVAAAPEVVAPVVAEAAAVVPPSVANEAVLGSSADDATVTADELAAAKTRIAELEAKLAKIDALIN